LNLDFEIIKIIIWLELNVAKIVVLTIIVKESNVFFNHEFYALKHEGFDKVFTHEGPLSIFEILFISIVLKSFVVKRKSISGFPY
jgi:hypothetical protein